MEYIIVGDTDKYKECLIYVCFSKENAEKVLDRVLNNPTEDDLRMTKGHTNLKVIGIPDRDCWWNYGTD